MMCRSISGSPILGSMQFFPNYRIILTVHIVSTSGHSSISGKKENKDQLLSGILERGHGGVMCGILKNSGKEQTFHGESVAREHGKDRGRRFFDLIEVDIAEKSLRVTITVGINFYGPNLVNISRERERLLMEQVEKEKEDMQFELVMKYACQMMQMRNSTTAKPGIVEEKVATAESSMTNRIMFTGKHKNRTCQEITWIFTSRVMKQRDS